MCSFAWHITLALEKSEKEAKKIDTKMNAMQAQPFYVQYAMPTITSCTHTLHERKTKCNREPRNNSEIESDSHVCFAVQLFGARSTILA